MFIFTLVLGALFGLSLDDGKINARDFKHVTEKLLKPLDKLIETAPTSIIKSAEGMQSIDAIINR